MTNTQVLIICGIFAVVWAYVLTVFKRKNMSAFWFIWGVMGAFSLTFILFKDILAEGCAKCLEYLLLGVQHFCTFYDVYPTYNIVFVNSKESAISLFIDYECSGAIEVLVLMSIILFFPKLSVLRRIIYIVLGFIYTMLANGLRMFAIAFAISKMGSRAYYMAHSVVGRIVFYILTVLLYFYMFTWQQIRTQITGRFAYGDSKQKSVEGKNTNG